MPQPPLRRHVPSDWVVGSGIGSPDKLEQDEVMKVAEKEMLMSLKDQILKRQQGAEWPGRD